MERCRSVHSQSCRSVIKERGRQHQIIESVNDTLKGQLDLEGHGGRTPQGVIVRVLQRLLALTAAIWHNAKIGAWPVRSLTAYDH